MPRKGVPYGGGICSLKERIAELFDLVGEKLHSINGVQGDGQGNVQIESGDDAIVITNDQIGHKIELSLDNSKLPAAAVSSVNGQTGAVVLNAGNIPTKNNANVQTDIDVAKEGLKNCIANIITEREARQNADAALQANINAVQGVVQADYVKKTGAAQTVTSQIMVPTTATGTRDTQIANGTRIQNDLDAYEYMVRTSGNQRPIIGIKACAFVANNFAEIDAFTTSKAGWHKIYTIKSTQRWIGVMSIFKNSNNYLLARATMYEYLIVINSAAVANMYYITRVGDEPQVRLTFDGTVWNVWVQCPAYQRTYIQLDSKAYVWGDYDAAYHVDPDYNTVTAEPAAEDYSVYKTPVTP